MDNSGVVIFIAIHVWLKQIANAGGYFHRNPRLVETNKDAPRQVARVGTITPYQRLPVCSLSEARIIIERENLLEADQCSNHGPEHWRQWRGIWLHLLIPLSGKDTSERRYGVTGTLRPTRCETTGEADMQS
jgi:hypothetical protein